MTDDPTWQPGLWGPGAQSLLTQQPLLPDVLRPGERQQRYLPDQPLLNFEGETMRRYISSRDDLANWVSTHVGDNLSDSDMEAITSTIQAGDHPAWGDDWTEFLEAMTIDDLLDMLPAE